MENNISLRSREWAAYLAYLREWSDGHSDDKSYGMTPACFDEWLDNEYARGAMPVDSYGRTAEEFLKEQFSDMYCPECGGDSIHHTAILLNDDIWFARCNYPPQESGAWHQVVDDFRLSTIPEEDRADYLAISASVADVDGDADAGNSESFLLPDGSHRCSLHETPIFSHWCEKNCPKYSSCDTIAWVNDEARELMG